MPHEYIKEKQTIGYQLFLSLLFSTLLILTVLLLAALVKAETPVLHDGLHEWRYKVTAVKAAYRKALKRSRTRPARKLRGRANNGYNGSFRRALKRHALEIVPDSLSNTGNAFEILSRRKTPSFPAMFKEVIPLSHMVYQSDTALQSPVINASGPGIFSRQSIPCPSTPIAVQCNGLTQDPIGSWSLSPDLGMNVGEAWTYSSGENVVVAILSTGIKVEHPDLTANLWTDTGGTFEPGESLHGFNAYANTSPDDLSGTGTALAGIISATANNSIGLAGVAYGARIMAVKAFDENELNKSYVIRSLEYVLKKKREGHNIRVVLAPNFYFGYSPGPDPELLSLTQQLNQEGILLVGSAPRFNQDSSINIDGSYNGYIYFPFNFQSGNILTSSSYTYVEDFNQVLSSPRYSAGQNIGPQTIHHSAPGELVYTADEDGGYIYYSGGSIAAANSAAVAALLFSEHPDLSPTHAIDALTSNVRLHPNFIGKTISGGIIDAGKALEALAPSFPAGDYNQSGCVDGQDYLLWQREYGSETLPGSGADGNGDGVVDAADYTIWRNNYGSCTP